MRSFPKWGAWALVAVGVAVMSVLVSFQWKRIVLGQNDFAGLYAGATLVGTPNLYDRVANEAVIQAQLGTTMPTVIYTRPPFYAVLLKPLATLSYSTAYRIFLLLDILSIAWFLWAFSKESPALRCFAAFSMPLAGFLPQGQDAPLLLTFTGLSVLLHRKKQPVLAGLIFSLCSIKFHLFLMIPVLLLVKRQWRMLAGASGGVVTLFLIGILGAGVDSTGQYITALRNPWINFSADMMPSLHGFSATLQAGPGLEIGLSCLVIGMFLWLCSRTDDFELLFSFGLVGSLLLSYHSGLSDDNLLLLGYVLISKANVAKYVQYTWAIMLTPISYALGLSIGVPAMMLAVLAAAVVSFTARSEDVRGNVPAVA